ncbi:HIT family protein [Candidatus Woesearchaeota archaeon]|nr:HIT family protein [Candidatus Woesearchaeota archaeon]
MAEQLTEEEIKNMSPEELKELQKQQCVFCQIVDGKVASKKIYEDDKCLGILDINPANPGHVLLMPKEHYPLLPLMPPDISEHLFIVSKAIMGAMSLALGTKDANIFIANGSAAGQRAPHFMLHIIPRKMGDGVKMEIPVNPIPEKELKEVKDKIQEKINIIFKLKKAETGAASEEKPAKAKEPTKKEESGVDLDDIADLL